MAKPAYEWRLEQRGGGNVGARSGLSGGRCSGSQRRRRGALSLKRSWPASEAPETATMAVATRSTRGRNASVEVRSTGAHRCCGAVSTSPAPKTRATGVATAQPLSHQRDGDGPRGSPADHRCDQVFGDEGGSASEHGRQAQPNCAGHPRSKDPRVTSTLSWTRSLAPQRRLDKCGARSVARVIRRHRRRRAGIWRFTECSLTT